MNRLRVCAQRLTLPILTLWLFLASTAVPATAAPWPLLVGRSTNDRDADLIAALIRAGRFDDARMICESQLRGVDRESDSAANWTIRQSQIAAARKMTTDRFDDADVRAAEQPIVALLQAYPRHRRGLFLEAQTVAVARQSALHSVLRAAVSPSQGASLQADRHLAATRLLRTTNAIESLSDRVDDARAQLDSQSGVRDFSLIADLARLQQELKVDAVSLALMQTELFPRGGVDCIAAATKAEQAADDAIAKLPAETAARLEVERLRVEAIFRAQQLGRAASELAKLTRAVGSPLPTRILAMHVRQDIASQSMEKANARLVSFYGDSPEVAPPSIEMDLARLEFLLDNARSGSVGAWLDVIEKRGGGYARRRAEAMSLARLRDRGSNGDRPMVDPSLVAAQGQDWLRRGQPGRAGELLSAAAAAESDPDKAIERSSEAAAALVSAGRISEAAGVLDETSLRNPTGANAAAAHLQAIVLISSSDDPNVGKRLETMLRANLKQWPSGEIAAAARNWLQKILMGQQRSVEAAEVATQVPVDQINDGDVRQMIDLWRAAFRSHQGDGWTELSDRFQASFQPLLESESVGTPYRLGAALMLDRDRLAELPRNGSHGSIREFADALIDFRQRSVVSDALRNPPQEYGDDATWRLMRDGAMYPKMRQPIARLLQQWGANSDDSLGHAERLLWVGDTEAAVAMMRKLIRAAPKSADVTRQAAELLGSSGQSQSHDQAIKLWDELAAGSKQGSRRWHDAKLAAIELLRRAGKTQEARRRAKYILLTTPEIEDELKRRYQSAIQ